MSDEVTSARKTAEEIVSFLRTTKCPVDITGAEILEENTIIEFATSEIAAIIRQYMEENTKKVLAVLQAYSKRVYHGYSHLLSMTSDYVWYAQSHDLAIGLPVLLGILYHDVVMPWEVSGKYESAEAESAAVFERDYSGYSFVHEIADAIRFTDYAKYPMHIKVDHNVGQLLRELDLNGLFGSKDVFDRNSEAIRDEAMRYAGLPSHEFEARRLMFLKGIDLNAFKGTEILGRDKSEILAENVNAEIVRLEAAQCQRK